MKTIQQTVLSSGVLLGIAVATNAATLVGSFHAPTTVDHTAVQSFSSTTRTSDGNANTQGSVAGTITAIGGHQVGDSSYAGLNLSTFSGNSSFVDLDRFSNDDKGGLITWDFDLSTYLSGKTIGTAAGNSMFSLDVDFSGRRSGGVREGLWYISYTGGGLTLDTTDITTHAGVGSASGTANAALVTNTSAYVQVLALGADTVSGTESVDLTSHLALIAAGDGQIRIAYREREFRGDINFLNSTGLVENIAVPEPSSALLLGLGGLSLILRRKK